MVIYGGDFGGRVLKPAERYVRVSVSLLQRFKMRWVRFFTQSDQEPFVGVRWRAISNEEGLEYIVPGQWSQAAVDILLNKVFYPEVPVL